MTEPQAITEPNPANVVRRYRRVMITLMATMAGLIGILIATRVVDVDQALLLALVAVVIPASAYVALGTFRSEQEVTRRHLDQCANEAETRLGEKIETSVTALGARVDRNEARITELEERDRCRELELQQLVWRERQREAQLEKYRAEIDAMRIEFKETVTQAIVEAVQASGIVVPLQRPPRHAG